MSVEIPRRAKRKSVALPAQCRMTSGMRDSGEISDISAQGCCVKTDTLLFRVGSHVIIRPTGMEPLGGTVRWIAGDCAGLEFDQPIYDPIVDHLARVHIGGAPIRVVRD